MSGIAKTIGIIGGGQLGRMLAMAANRLDADVIILEPQENAPASAFAKEQIIAAYDDVEALHRLAKKCDVVTYEFENVSVEALKKADFDTPLSPNIEALKTSQDRLVEKSFFKDLGIKTAPFENIENADALEAALVSVGGKGILKTRRMGYDGKGQIRVTKSDIESLKQAKELASDTPCILEGFVPFTREISIIAARGDDSKIASYAPAENVHKNGILHTSTIPASITSAVEKDANAIAAKVLHALNYIGVIGIEFFVMETGELLVNEFAPRVHNSGHWTEAACIISQFEQHIRAITALPLGNTDHHSDCVMENLIGFDIDRVPEILQMKDTLLNMYGKAEARNGRKMGHFTSVSPKTTKI